jgi:hypothetical protein
MKKWLAMAIVGLLLCCGCSSSTETANNGGNIDQTARSSRSGPQSDASRDSLNQPATPGQSAAGDSAATESPAGETPGEQPAADNGQRRSYTSTRPPAAGGDNADTGESSASGNPGDVAGRENPAEREAAGEASGEAPAAGPAMVAAFPGTPGNVGLGKGELVPEIIGEDLEGTEFRLSDYQGKVIMLDFWGDW